MSGLDEALNLMASLVLEDGRTWGSVAAPFQLEDAEAIFDPAQPLWNFLTRPRGGSKSTDLAAVLLAWLVCFAATGEHGYVIATDKDQGSFAVLDAVGSLVGRTPALLGRVTVQANKITSKAGASVEVLSADGASTWGLRPAFIVCDELAQWPSTRNARNVWSALLSATGKMAGCRLVILTSAGEPSHWSHKVLATALKSDRWRVHEVPGPLPWADPANLAAQRQLLRESEYARLHENIWTVAEDRLVTAEDLAAAAVLDGPLEPVPGRRYIVAVDLGLTNDRTVCVIAHAEPVDKEWGSSKRVVVDRIARWRGTRRKPVTLAEVEAWLLEATTRYNRAKVVADPWQAAGLCQRLRQRHVQVEEFVFSSASVGRIGSGLHLALRNRLLSLPNDEDLLSELGNVRLKETTPGVVRLDHDSGQHDDQAVAVGLACVTLATESASGMRPVFFDVDHVPEPHLMPLIGGRGIVGFTQMPDSVQRISDDDDDEDGPAPGATAVSPFQ